MIKIDHERLKQAVRDATTLEDLAGLYKLVGPSEKEKEAASNRLKEMDFLWFCKGGTFMEEPHRSRYNRLIEMQTEFENKYF